MCSPRDEVGDASRLFFAVKSFSLVPRAGVGGR